ncbi:hypothetical protein SUNI508_09033 [Seiridium unicorne]|uniref:Uncharacterized protein n=1 Tax=Seiridium unicorne TaxID=138068 RepID=A0ABR2URG1_9PEZI
MEGLSSGEVVGRWDEIINSGGECTREEYALVRRLNAAGLAQSLGDEQIQHPLSLVDPGLEVSNSQQLTSAQSDYVDSIKRYAEGHEKFVDVVEQQKTVAKKAREQKAAAEKEKALDQEIIELHLKVAELQKEHDRRRTIIKCLDELDKMPAAQPDFLAPEVMYQDCSPLPEMPKVMIDGFATDHSATDAKAEELLQNLKKHVLRSKLMAQRQQANYERSQSENPLDMDSLSPEAKLHALNSVKNSLINWIETQLAKAGDDGADSDAEQKPDGSRAEYDHGDMMAVIQQKYQRHVDLRQQIINQLAQTDLIKERLKLTAGETRPPKNQKSALDAAPRPTAKTDAYLLTPYIEQLQILARQQKQMVQEKSYINGSLTRQHEDTRQILDHMAEESQLLSRYPMAKEPSKSQPSFEDVTGDHMRIGEQVRPWIYAADSAKLATLEEVAENVETGMESIDEARAHLEHVCKLLNIPFLQQEEGTTPKDDAEDIEKTSKSPRRGQAKKNDDGTLKTIWDILDGNLGSINE